QFEKFLPNKDEGAGEIFRTALHPTGDLVALKPLAGFNFVRMQHKWSFMERTIRPTEFLTGCRASIQFKHSDRWPGQADADFLQNLAHGAGIVVLATVQVSRGRRIPGAWRTVLFHGTLLQEDLALLVENQDVHGPMFQATTKIGRAS